MANFERMLIGLKLIGNFIKKEGMNVAVTHLWGFYLLIHNGWGCFR
jgi:hypothetical protein